MYHFLAPRCWTIWQVLVITPRCLEPERTENLNQQQPRYKFYFRSQFIRSYSIASIHFRELEGSLTLFTRVWHLSLSWAILIQWTCFHPIFKYKERQVRTDQRFLSAKRRYLQKRNIEVFTNKMRFCMFERGEIKGAFIHKQQTNRRWGNSFGLTGVVITASRYLQFCWAIKEGEDCLDMLKAPAGSEMIIRFWSECFLGRPNHRRADNIKVYLK